MKEIALSIDKMRHLQELGLDCSKASMAWQANSCMKDRNEWLLYAYGNCNLSYRHVEKTFCLSDILELLPDDLRITKATINNKPYYVGNFINNSCDFNFDGNSILEMAYEMLCWCIENGYIKTNKDENV